MIVKWDTETWTMYLTKTFIFRSNPLKLKTYWKKKNPRKDNIGPPNMASVGPATYSEECLRTSELTLSSSTPSALFSMKNGLASISTGTATMEDPWSAYLSASTHIYVFNFILTSPSPDSGSTHGDRREPTVKCVAPRVRWFRFEFELLAL